MLTVEINQKQARISAHEIFPDIKKYVETHHQEFKEFLREEAKSEKGDKK